MCLESHGSIFPGPWRYGCTSRYGEQRLLCCWEAEELLGPARVPQPWMCHLTAEGSGQQRGPPGDPAGATLAWRCHPCLHVGADDFWSFSGPRESAPLHSVQGRSWMLAGLAANLKPGAGYFTSTSDANLPLKNLQSFFFFF